MSKNETIAMICQLNASVEEAFLASFDETALSQYLARLAKIHGHRGRETRWVRDGATTAIVTRTHPPAPAPTMAA